MLPLEQVRNFHFRGKLKLNPSLHTPGNCAYTASLLMITFLPYLVFATALKMLGYKRAPHKLDSVS